MRKRVRRRIFGYSLVAALIATVLAAGMVLFLRGVIPFVESGDTNRATLNAIHCREGEGAPELNVARRRCDLSEILNDPGEGSSDYVLTRDGRYFLITTPGYPNHWLNVLDLAFIRSFRQPATVVLPTDETWRLYSQPVQMGQEKIEVLVGIMEEGPATFVKVPVTQEIDQLLAEEARRVVSRISVREGHLYVGGINTRADTWQIVDGETGRVVKWIENAVGRFPADERLRPGFSFHWERGNLFLTRIDANDDLFAITLSQVANIWAFLGALGAIFVGVCASVYAICATRFRRYFLLMGGRRISVAEALRAGEGQCVEFKRDSDHPDSILKAITAFANTNDGTVFIGIADDRRVEGIRADSPKERDKFYQRILNAARERIRPLPVIDVDFEAHEGSVVAKIFVPRGEERIYSLGGRFYVRKGVESVFAEGDDIARLMEQYA